MSGMDGISSLLNFLAAPLIVGDPEGGVAYVNPAFERAFSRPAAEACGESLASLFGGGGREAVLGAVAEVCERGETVKFRLRENGVGYLGLASPIEAERDRVGVVILLTDEPELDERLLAYQNEIGETLDEAMHCLEDLIDQTGGRRAESHREGLERGIAALERARKWNDELHGAVCGVTGGARNVSRVDPIQVAHQVGNRVGLEVQHAGLEFRLASPARLEAARADAAMLETALVRLIRHRIAQPQKSDSVCLLVRATRRGDAILFSVVDRPDSGARGIAENEPEPKAVRATVAALGGRMATLDDPELGRVTSIALESSASS